MASNKNVPEFVSDFIGDENPQAARASEGLVQGAKYLLDSGNGSVAQAPAEGVEPEADPLTSAAGAYLGSKLAQGAAGIIGNEVGTLGSRASGEFTQKPLVTGKVTNSIKQSNVALEPSGVQNPLVNGKPNYGKVLWEQGPLVKPNYGKVVRKAEGGLMMAPTHAFADGGEVAETVVPAAPDFVNEFNSAPISQPNVVNPDTTQTPQLNTNTQPAEVSVDSGVPSFVADYIQPELQQAKYGTPSQQAIAGLEGAAQGLVGPLAPLAEKALGVSPEAIRGRAEANPITHGGSELATLAGGMMTGLGEGALIGKAGQLTAKAIGEGGNLAKIVGRAAAQGFVENALMSSGDEVSKLILNDPNASAQTAIANVGLSGLLGAGIGGAFGAVAPLWKASTGNKLGQTIEDFKARGAEHMADPDPVASMTKEAGDLYSNTTSIADEVYGPTGLKAQEIAAVMPEMSDKIASQSEQITDKLQNAITKLKNDPHLNLMQDEASKYMQALNSNDPSTIFNATQTLKQQAQEWGKYNKNISPLAERNFRNAAKDLAFSLRESLEDPKVWGKAAERQMAINKAFTEYLPALKDFEKKFTVEVAGERVIDPGKIQTYVNQLGKPNAEIKQTMLKNFLDASEKYKDVIASSHGALGIDSPIVNSSTNALRASLKERTLGSRMMDHLIDLGLKGKAGNAVGATVGGAIGHAVGSPGFGGLIGAHALGPFFNSILPSLAKPMLKGISNSSGAKAAIDFSANVHQGDKILSKAVSSIFKAGQLEAVKPFKISDSEAAKLDKKIAELQENPQAMGKIGGSVGHYLPDHNASLAQTAVNAVNYLNSLRPNSGKLAPLDSPRVPSSVEKANYNRALTIAERPASILDAIKTGTLTSTDMITLRTLYPQLYNQMTDKITAQIADMGNKKQNIPYNVRMGLSLFLGQAVDSSMLPQNILSAQPKPSAGQQQPGNQPQAPVKHKTAALTKWGQQNQTKSQSAEQAQITRK